MAFSNPEALINEIKRYEESTKDDQESIIGNKVSKSSNRNTNSNAIRVNRSKRLKGLINHEYCDSCEEGGNLVNCDRCPASFHFICFEPPLDDNDPNLLKNEFLCNRCKSNDSKQSSIQLGIYRSRNSVRNESNQQQSNSNTNKQSINFEIIENESALKTLIRLAKMMNPQQMELPKNIKNTFEIPGLSKIQWWTKEGNKILDQKEALSKKKENKDSFAPIPNKICFVCGKTSRVGCLIKCDFCPLNYHLDCLNPPLCCIPKDRWMCPNHIEHILDKKLLYSKNRLSARIKLWNKYSNIDTHVVKFEFIKKIQDYKIKKSLLRNDSCDDQEKTKNEEHICNGTNKFCSKIPNAIKQFYLNPIKIEDVYKSIDENIKEEQDVDESLKPSDIDKEIWLSALECLTSFKLSKNEDVNKVELPEILEKQSSQPTTTVEESSQLLTNEILKINKNIYSQLPVTKYCRDAIKPRAFMYYLSNSNDIENKNFNEYSPCHMVYRTFAIGTNIDNDLCLTKYEKKCEYVSNRHACIYYDEYSNHYELLNYSENGTIVDNILYSNDISMKSDYDDNDDNIDDDDDDDNDDESTNSDDLINKKPKMSSRLGKNYWSCKCKCSLTDIFDGKCWEGSAILNHGSHLRFGCLEFLFCIIDYDINDDVK